MDFPICSELLRILGKCSKSLILTMLTQHKVWAFLNQSSNYPPYQKKPITCFPRYVVLSEWGWVTGIKMASLTGGRRFLCQASFWIKTTMRFTLGTDLKRGRQCEVSFFTIPFDKNFMKVFTRQFASILNDFKILESPTTRQLQTIS